MLDNGHPAPPPADGEVAELVETLKGIAYWRRHGKPGEPAPTSFDIRQADRLTRAADLLERLASPACMVLKPSPELIEALEDGPPGRVEPLLEWLHPTPMPVSERLPEPEDCDAEGRCWFGTPGCDVWGASWVLRKRSHQRNGITSWLPAHALPLPEVNNG